VAGQLEDLGGERAVGPGEEQRLAGGEALAEAAAALQPIM